jgi:plasmid maintenance system antidote protein VapI
MTLAKQLKTAVQESGKSVSCVARESGMAQAVLQRFIAGNRDLRLDTVERLADYFGWEFAAKTAPAKPKASPKPKAKRG